MNDEHKDFNNIVDPAVERKWKREVGVLHEQLYDGDDAIEIDPHKVIGFKHYYDIAYYNPAKQSLEVMEVLHSDLKLDSDSGVITELTFHVIGTMSAWEYLDERNCGMECDLNDKFTPLGWQNKNVVVTEMDRITMLSGEREQQYTRTA